MNKRYRLKLYLTLFIFAFLISLLISTIDYKRMKEKLVESNGKQIEQVTASITHILDILDKAHVYLDEETTKKMTENSHKLVALYEENSDFSTWDFEALSKENDDMDIYIFDEENVILHSSVKQDIGWDFNVCCPKMTEILKERRETGHLYVDGIDLDQKSGEMKRYSYIATKDKKYIIELGYSLENETIYKQFNFIKLTDDLTKEFTFIEEMNVLNFGGVPFGANRTEYAMEERREAFQKARNTLEVVDLIGEYNEEDVRYRYIPYTSEYDKATTNIKVVEIVYNYSDLKNLLKEQEKNFYMQLIIIFFSTLIVSSFIARWFATPVYLAYHDSLTGLKNRASFDESIRKFAKENKKNIALFMLDLDHFKLVNDHYGHDHGDAFLKKIADTLQQILPQEYIVFRLGGDEFIILMHGATKESVEIMASYLIQSINEKMKVEDLYPKAMVTVSLGIAIADQLTDEGKELYKQADRALYEAKAKGKNQFKIYNEETN